MMIVLFNCRMFEYLIIISFWKNRCDNGSIDKSGNANKVNSEIKVPTLNNLSVGLLF